MIDNQIHIQGSVLTDNQAAYRALNESHFVPFFQPLVILRTGQLAGFEVLARWQHPTAGLIPPNKFIAIAEQDGWIGALTQQILEKALLAGASIPDPLTLAVNVSPFQLRDLQLPNQIRSMAEKAGFPLSRLVVEITESALVEDLQSAIAVVAELKAMGCKLALDDFGTGYSSLHHLQSLPFDELKVDRSFVSSMTEKRDSRKIVSAVVGLGQSLGLTTVAEGIETQEQAEMMLWLGCELGQGYFYGRPMPSEELHASISAHRDKLLNEDPGTVERVSASNLDVSPTQRLAQLRAVYDGAPIGLAFVDQNLRYVNLNKRLAEMNGIAIENHLGRQVSEVIPNLFPHVEPYLKRALCGEVITDVEAKVPGNEETRLVSYQPAVDEGGEVVGVSICVADITERRRTEDALKASEAHYRSMVELDPHVLWIMDPQGRNLNVCPRWDKATGLMKTQSADQNWLKNVHPEDMRATVRSIAGSRRTGSPIDVRYRVADSQGSWAWKRAMGAPRFDVNGNIVCWYGSVQDIDAQSKLFRTIPPEDHGAVKVATNIHVMRLPDEIRSREDLRQEALLDLEILDTPAEAEYDDLVALASEICGTPISLVTLIDSDRQWFKASIGLAKCETPISSSFCAHAVEQQGLFLVEDANKDERFRNNPLVLGEPGIRFYAGMPLYASEGIAVGTLCVIDTVPRTLSPGQAKALAILSHQVQARMELRSERRKLLRALEANRELMEELTQSNQTLEYANSQLERLATVDFLTGMLNRRAFEDRMKAEFSNASRKQRSLSLLILDIDNFKKRNDQFGHAAGDDALRRVGEILQKAVRADDSVARIGGEEFAILLPETTPDQASMIARRVQELLELSADEEMPRITVSIGIACLEATMTNWETLFQQADLAMYEAKQTGKNRFVVHETEHVV